jgi:hypothetical protein
VGPTETTRADASTGDDISVVPEPVTRRRRRPWRMVATAAAIVFGATLVFILGTRDDSPAKVRTIVPAALDRGAPLTNVPAASTPKPEAKGKTPAPKTTTPAPHDVTPATRPRPVVVVPATTPPPTAAPRAELSATVTPSHTSVHAGDALVVTLHVTNRGNAEGRYAYANDTCPRALVAPAGQICGQAMQTFAVPANSTVDHDVTIDTERATRGSYTVAFQTVSVTVEVK